MKKNILFLFLAFAGIIAQAQIPNGYYDNATGKSGNDLKIALHNIIKGHHQVSYSGLLDAFAYTDCKANGKIWDIYSNYEFSLSGSCGSYQHEGDCWNREHTWPQSWFNEQSIPRSDLFHVYPTDGYVNNRRSNYPYGEVNNPTYTSGNGSKLGPCATAGYTSTVFEPIDEYKGDIARSYFYMSVRYYSEDSGWGTSGMTNKSEILPWAMTMLLRWSDEDPVSDKEIARNNAVYGYQNNRNPFIDHPEYARMIWDENWQGGVSYNITCATGLSHGSVSAPANAMEGSTVSITATPDLGYMVSAYSVYKTGSPSTTVSVSSNGTFTMPGYAVTVSATFVQNSNYYDIALGSVSHGSISASKSSAKSGTTINLTATPNSDYSLYSWYVYKTGDMNTTISVTNPNNTSASFVMPAFNVTVMATFVQGSSGNGDYVKVTSAPSDWSGEYILVYEQSTTTGYVWTGVDATNCYVSKTISNNTIEYDNSLVTITIAPMSGGYSVRVNGGTNDGKYIYGSSSDNKVNFGSSATLNTFSYESNSVKMTSNNSVMRFNNASGNMRFRYFKSGTYSQQQPIQLYKQTSSSAPAPTHTIYFEGNGGTGSMNNQTINEFEPTALNTNAFTRTGFVFDGWNTAADGLGDYYADGATITLFDDLTLYAQWDQLFTITVAEVANGSIGADLSEALEETTVTLTATPDLGYEFGHWNVTDENNNAIIVTENQFEMPASNVTVSATFTYVGLPFDQKYYLVTSTNQLVVGRTYLIVNTEYGKALGTTQNGNNRSAGEVTVNNDVIANIGDDVCELTLGGGTGAWTLKDGTKGYLYAAGGGNYLRTQPSLNDRGKWTISFSGKNAVIVSNGESDRNTIQYNMNNTIFSCYSSGQKVVQLFIRSEEIPHNSNETLTQVFSFDKHVVKSGTTLTLGNNVTFTDPGMLVIEGGGQLIHSTTGVKATFQKNITGYEGNSGWYTIASPFINYDPEEITSDDFDLYYYDEDGCSGEDGVMEWINYKGGNGNFTFNDGQGYLYAHNPSVNLHMTGTLNSGTSTKVVNLSYNNSHAFIRGFNLLGNHTAHDITFTKSENVSDGYYYVENGEHLTYIDSDTVPAGRGFFVKANAANQTVTLNPQSKGHDGETVRATSLQIDVDGEKAYVKMTKGVSMPLIVFRGKTPNFYLSQEGKRYIMLVRDNAESVELNYHAQGKGNHTLTVSTKGLETSYLHLIDRITGADIDLLATPSYTFVSDSHDYEKRFQLRFAKGVEEIDNEVFAYYQNGKIVLPNINEPYELQIIDVKGRSVSQLVPGVYLLRLITPNNIRTQKIVIK